MEMRFNCAYRIHAVETVLAPQGKMKMKIDCDCGLKTDCRTHAVEIILALQVRRKLTVLAELMLWGKSACAASIMKKNCLELRL
jgi:hypothetical protein